MTTQASLTIARQGFRRATSKWGVLGVLYVVNLMITLPLALVFRISLASIIGDMPAIDGLFSGFQHTIYSDIVRNHADAFQVFMGMFIPVAFASVIVHAIAGVGLVRVMDADGAAREFFGGIVSFGLRAVRLLLVYLLFGGLLFALAAFLATMFFSVLTEGNTTEDSYLLALLLSGLAFAVAASMTVLGAEYGRILTVRENRTSMFKSGWDGLLFVLRHPIRMIMLHGSVFLMLVAGALLYWLVDGMVEMTSGVGVFIMLFVQQAFILFRLLTRMWNTANGVAFSAGIASTIRPSFVKAPSVHDRRTPYREPLEKEAGRPSGSPSGGERRGGPPQEGRADRPGYRRRGRRRGSGGGKPQVRGPSAPSPKPDAKPPASEGTAPTSEQTGAPKGDKPKGGRPRRRRRPPRRPSGNQGT